MFDFKFFFNSITLGAGLAMDAFSVSLANGLNEPCMRRARAAGIAGVFAFFQGLMPLFGWVCVHTVVEKFAIFEKFIPWIALALLGFIGTKMLVEGIRCRCSSESESCECQNKRVSLAALLLQGVATSIDALSVGFTISEYDITAALVSALIIAAITFVICLGGIFLGKKFGTAFAGKSSVFGGIILIVIGLEIFITSFFG